MSDKPSIIKDVEKRYMNRKKRKALFDDTVELNVKQPETAICKMASKSSSKIGDSVRLLDEGYVMYADGSPDFYIKKGVIEKMYADLDPNYVGHINVGHADFASFPFPIGTWTKKDLKVVDIGKGRKGLDVKLNLDKDSIFVKEMIRQDIPLGVSIEMYVKHDWSQETMSKTGVRTVEEADMFALAVVGEAANAGSGGINLKVEGDNMGFLEKLRAKYAVPEGDGTNDAKDEGIKPNADGKIEMSVEDYDKLTECMSTAEGIIKDHEEALELMKVMDEAITAKENEVKELTEKLAAAEKEAGKATATDERITDALSHFKTLTASWKKDADEQRDKDAVHMKVTKPYEELSDDGFGGDL